MLSIPPHPPKDEQELFNRALNLAGFKIKDLANYANIKITNTIIRNKGWIGMLLELYLGAISKNNTKKDFENIGIELKSIPINKHGQPLQTVSICMAQLTGNHGITWKNSYVSYKLKRILWIPIEGEKEISLKNRKIGIPLIWSPNIEEENKLEKDWNNLIDLITFGNIKYIRFYDGEALQLRTKFNKNYTFTTAINKIGKPIKTHPLGFYLKKHFILQIFEKYYQKIKIQNHIP